MDTENLNHDDNESVPSEEIEITGGDNLGEEFPIEESQNELERIEKLEQEKKKFLEEIQNKKGDDASEGDKDVQDSFLFEYSHFFYRTIPAQD